MFMLSWTENIQFLQEGKRGENGIARTHSLPRCPPQNPKLVSATEVEFLLWFLCLGRHDEVEKTCLLTQHDEAGHHSSFHSQLVLIWLVVSAKFSLLGNPFLFKFMFHDRICGEHKLAPFATVPEHTFGFIFPITELRVQSGLSEGHRRSGGPWEMSRNEPHHRALRWSGHWADIC